MELRVSVTSAPGKIAVKFQSYAVLNSFTGNAGTIEFSTPSFLHHFRILNFQFEVFDLRWPSFEHQNFEIGTFSEAIGNHGTGCPSYMEDKLHEYWCRDITITYYGSYLQ